MSLSSRLAPDVTLLGHTFNDKSLVDDVRLLLVCVDILHANGDQMSIDNLLRALRHYGIMSMIFFRQKYSLGLEDWLARFIYYFKVSKGMVTLTTPCKEPPKAKVIKSKKRDTILQKLEQFMDQNGGIAPSIQQFSTLCRKEAKLDLIYITAKLNLPNNPSLAIQWLLPQIVEIRCGTNQGVYPLPGVGRVKHYSWHPPPQPVLSSTLPRPPPKPAKFARQSVTRNEQGTDLTKSADVSETSQTIKSESEIKQEIEPALKPNMAESSELKGVGNDVTRDEFGKTLIKGVFSPLPMKIQLSDSATLFEKRQIPSGTNLALSFDDDSQPLYSEMDRAKIIKKKAASSDEEVLLVLSCLPSEYSKAIVPYILSNPSYLHAIILDHGCQILLKYVDRSQENVDTIDVNIQQVLETVNKALSSSIDQTVNTSSSNLTTTDSNPRKINKTKLSEVSVSCNSHSEIYNITFHVSRFVPEAASLIQDLTGSIIGKPSRSLLVVGTYGSGKTTLLCEIARLLSKKKNKNVRVVDRNNEMGGDNATAHARVGGARRQRSNLSFNLLIREAVQIHHADVLVVDGITTREEVQEVCAAIRRGVAVVASVAQYATLQSLYEDPDLYDLLAHGDPSKCVFDTALELTKVNSMRVHHNLRNSVVALREGRLPAYEKRWITKTGAVLARLDDPDWKAEFSPEIHYTNGVEQGDGEAGVGDNEGEDGEAEGEGDEESWVEGECVYVGEEYDDGVPYGEGETGENGYGYDEGAYGEDDAYEYAEEAGNGEGAGTTVAGDVF